MNFGFCILQGGGNDGLSVVVVGKGVTDNGSDSELVDTDADDSDKNDHVRTMTRVISVMFDLFFFFRFLICL